jgi:hypothetical protein
MQREPAADSVILHLEKPDVLTGVLDLRGHGDSIAAIGVL